MTNENQTDAGIEDVKPGDTFPADGPEHDPHDNPEADVQTQREAAIDPAAAAEQFAKARANAARQAMFVQMKIQLQATIMNGILASMAPEDDSVSVARAGRIADMILADNGITRA